MNRFFRVFYSSFFKEFFYSKSSFNCSLHEQFRKTKKKILFIQLQFIGISRLKSKWRRSVSLATWTTGSVGSVLRVGYCWLRACVDLVSTLSSMSVWLCSTSDMTGLNDERRTDPG